MQHVIGFFERCARRRPVVEHESAFVEFGNEFRAERTVQQIRTYKNAKDHNDDDPTIVQREPQHRFVAFYYRAENPAMLFLFFTLVFA